MSDPLHLTILYEEGDDGWILASVPEVPGVLTQGRTKAEAREMALDALAGTLELRAAP
ncbi:MAG TPA: type II toxin-antitoxin system HicB family antitoxin [Solirubrobacterales bacterium]|nr:type II toxin-antitoxin system HicB family antitoxin [Solirubrobacterales bacterium]